MRKVVVDQAVVDPGYDITRIIPGKRNIVPLSDMSLLPKM